jgi:hypothetical protein
MPDFSTVSLHALLTANLATAKTDSWSGYLVLPPGTASSPTSKFEP